MAPEPKSLSGSRILAKDHKIDIATQTVTKRGLLSETEEYDVCSEICNASHVSVQYVQHPCAPTEI